MPEVHVFITQACRHLAYLPFLLGRLLFLPDALTSPSHLFFKMISHHNQIFFINCLLWFFVFALDRSLINTKALSDVHARINSCHISCVYSQDYVVLLYFNIYYHTHSYIPTLFLRTLFFYLCVRMCVEDGTLNRFLDVIIF